MYTLPIFSARNTSANFDNVKAIRPEKNQRLLTGRLRFPAVRIIPPLLNTHSFVRNRQYVILANNTIINNIIIINPLTPNDPYSGRTAPLTSKCCIIYILCIYIYIYIYSTNTSTEYFKHRVNSPFFPLQNAVCFIILTYLVPVLFTFYIQSVLKFKKIIPAPKS